MWASTSQLPLQLHVPSPGQWDVSGVTLPSPGSSFCRSQLWTTWYQRENLSSVLFKPLLFEAFLTLSEGHDPTYPSISL